MAEYLEREAVKAALEEHLNPDIAYDFILDDIPSADVQPVKHGRWIFNKPPNNWAEMHLSPKSFYVCDICGHIVDDISNYCPGCGAVMDGGDF